jgi:hypothetical protein
MTFTTSLFSQAGETNPVTYILHLNSGIFPGDNNWSFDHPIHNGSSITWETVEGKASGGMFYEVGFERKKNKLGFKLSVGLKPSEITVYQGESIDEEHIFNFNTNYLGLEANYYFGSENKPVRPYLGCGLGYIFLTGDSKTGGSSFSIGGGVNIKIMKRISFMAGIDWKLINYINYVEGEGFTRTIHIKPFIIKSGIFYRFNL